MDTRSDWFTPERILDVLTVALTLVLAIYLVTFTQATREAGECQEAVNASFRAALTTRTVTAGQERAALREVLVDVLSQPSDERRSQESLTRYLAVLDRAERERAAAPLPDGSTCR